MARSVTLTLGDGDVFNGELVGDQMEGYGEVTHTDGTTYKGNFKNNTKHGEG